MFTTNEIRIFWFSIIIAILFGLSVATVTSYQREIFFLKSDIEILSQRLNEDQANYLGDIARNDIRIQTLEQSLDSKTTRWTHIKLVRDSIKNIANVSLPVEESTYVASAIVDKADEFDVPVNLIMAIIKCESNFNKNAESLAGARGLMQLLPSTAESTAAYLNIKYYDLYSTKHNIHLGVAHLAKLLHQYKNDSSSAIRAYNCGVQCVANVSAGKWPNYPEETILYLDRVNEWKKMFDSNGISW